MTKLIGTMPDAASPDAASPDAATNDPKAAPSDLSVLERPGSVAPAQRKVYLKTFGCQMNVYDSERMGEMLSAEGYADTADPAEADLVILNTCHIREKAVEKVYSDLGRLRDLKIERQARGLETTIAVTGCVAQAEGAEIARRAPAVDVVVGPQSYHRLPELALAARKQGRAQIETTFPEDDKFNHLPARRAGPGPGNEAGNGPGNGAESRAANGVGNQVQQRPASAFLTVQEGCDKFCTFCVVPYTRGAEYSRSVGKLLDEARRLVAQGVREITLLGQNVNAYHGEGPDGGRWTLARLMYALADIPDLERLRYMTSHPRDMSDDLIAAHRDCSKLMPFLHLPFQAGADRILAAMNRKHTAREYLALIARIRAVRPDLALSTDVIVGFPGETEAEFDATLAVVREIGFAQAYSFKYSPRPGTPAATIGEQVPEEVKSERLARLQALLDEQQTAFNAASIGQTIPVLFERVGRDGSQLVGRTPHLQLVHAEAAPLLLGRIIAVEIRGSGQTSLRGVIKAA